ncbi:hypothetical protein H6P81_007102 [Aristolochia fimbriata]|uniref:Cytochrome P450 n=1 Tax=Aristolochia fimbriata TaxID=158543 RepID=A0AAV7EZJ6_ARIFI|nr:hypothetical protein H6P81_007102 [Aristolochia fimbriata]
MLLRLCSYCYSADDNLLPPVLYLRRPTRLQPLADGKEAPEALGSWPILGHIPMLVMNRPLLHRLFSELADQHGPAFTVRAGQLRILVVSSWEMAKECLFVNHRVLADRPDLLAYKHLPPLFALAPYGPFWRESRKIFIQNVLSTANLESFQTLWVSEIAAGKRYSSTTGNVDQEGDAEARQFIRLFGETLYYMGLQDVGDAFPFLRRFDLLGHGRALKKIGREVDELMQKWIDEHRLRDNNICSSTPAAAAPAGTPVDRDAMLPLLLKLTTLSLLVNNRHVLEKAHAELDLPVGRDRIVEASDITKLVYLQSIVKEALRLYPPGPLLAPHRAMEDCRIGGFHVPKGTTVMINAWKIHRDPRIFVNPLQFRPERFMEENKEIDVLGQHADTLWLRKERLSWGQHGLATRALDPSSIAASLRLGSTFWPFLVNRYE